MLRSERQRASKHALSHRATIYPWLRGGLARSIDFYLNCPEQLKQAAVAYKIGKYPFTADPRSRANGTTEGFVKVLADKGTDKVLGVHIIGAEAGTMIAEAATAMEFSASAEDIGRICHAHPSLSEATKEAALAVDKRALNF